MALKKSKDKENRKSCIRFSESRIEGGKWVTYTRNAIDRFTGGTVDGALYTEKTYYNGIRSCASIVILVESRRKAGIILLP